MIFVLGDPNDQCVALTHARLNARGTATVLLEDLFSRGWSAIAPSPRSDGGLRGRLQTAAGAVPLAGLRSVLARPGRVGALGREMSPGDADYVRQEAEAALTALLHGLPCRVVNRPHPGATGRPLFASAAASQHAAACGFAVPRTLVTSSLETAAAFYRQCGDRAVLGSAVTRTEWVDVQGSEGLARIADAVCRAPIALQQAPAGERLQVLTIGSGAIAGTHGWTEDGDEVVIEPVTMSSALREQCRRLVEGLGLDLAAVHVVAGNSGTVYCTEVSDRPSYAGWRDDVIATATAMLVELLEGEEPGR